MALSGKFIADFSEFKTAVDQSIVQLRSFETSANKVGTSMNRMTDQFSGRRVIQEATLMSEVFQRAGGSAAFTEKELARMGATGAEAVAKLKALGMDVPPGIQRIADAARTTGGFFNDLGRQVLTTAAGFISAQAVLHGVGMAFNAVKDAARAMWDIALSGAAVADVEGNFQRLTSQAGLLGDVLLGSLRTGTHATITDFELMKTVNQNLAAGLRLTDVQFGVLARGAFALAQATGGDVKTALDTMNDAMLTGRTRSLALLTGKIDLEAAETKFAHSVGTTAKNLSEAGKLEAARVAILDGVSAATARLGVQTDGLDERVAQAQASWGNFKEQLGKTVAQSTVLEAGLVAVTVALTGTFGNDKKALIDAIAHKIDDAAIGMIRLAETAVTAGGGIVTGFYAVKKIFGDVAQVIDGVTLATLYFGKAQLTLTNVFGSSTAALQKNDAVIGNLLTTMLLRGQALQEDDKAQAGVNATTQKYIATLEGVRAKMAAAGASGVQTAAALAQVAGAQAGATAGAQAGAAAWTSEASALKGATAALKERTAAETAYRAVVNEIGVREIEDVEKQNKIKLDLERNYRKAVNDLGEREIAEHARLNAWKIADDAAYRKSRNDVGLLMMAEDAARMEAMRSNAERAAAGMASAFSQIGPTIMAAMQGGGDAIKSISSLFGGELTKSIFGGDAMKKTIADTFGATLGSAFNALLPGIGALAGPLIGKIAGLFHGLFGASEAELAGRSMAESFREELEKTLTVTQKLEAGNDAWKKSVIAIRDAYIAAGKTEQAALAVSERLWRAEKEGPDAVKRVIEEIAEVMRGSFTNAIVSTGAIAQETLTGVANAAIDEANRIAASVKYYDRGTGQTGMDARSMSSAEAKRAIDDFVAKGGSRAKAEEFLQNNPGDEGRLAGAFFDTRPYQGMEKEEYEKLYGGERDTPGFAGGTNGRYLDFGGGTDVRLHGREMITPEGEGRGLAASLAALLTEFRRLSRSMDTMHLKMRDAMKTTV